MYRTLENNELENFDGSIDFSHILENRKLWPAVCLEKIGEFDACKLDRLIALAKLFAIMERYGFSIQYLLNVLLNFHEIDLCHL
jgi:hypothetical protein